MKLKKILSLALSGILAVSMLAACGGGNIFSGNRASRQTTSVLSAMNAELVDLDETTVTYKGNGDLRKAVSNIADTITVVEAAKANNTGAIADASVITMAKRYVNITNDASFATHTNPSDGAVWGTIVLFDGDLSASDVGEAMAENVNKWGLERLTGFEFEGAVEAYKVTIPATDSESDDVTVWLVGVTLTETAKKA